MNATESLSMKILCLKVVYQSNSRDVFQMQSNSTWAFLWATRLLNYRYRNIYFITEQFMETTWDLLPFSCPVRPKASDSPEPGDNILPLPLAYNLGHTWLLTEGSRTEWYIWAHVAWHQFGAAGFPSILFTTVTGREQGFSQLDLNGTHERRQDRGMQEPGHWVTGNLQSSSCFKLCCL